MKSIVALLVLVASVCNSNALPRDGSDAVCTEDESLALKVDLLSWAGEVLAQNPRPKAAAASVIKECDANGDGTLTVTEFVACLVKKFDDDDISDSCYAFLEESADANGDGIVSLDELTGFFGALSQGKARSEQETRQSRRFRRSADDAVCSQEDSLVLQQSLAGYLQTLLGQGTPEEVAGQIGQNCDADEDKELSAEEFVQCIKLVVNADVSASCFENLAFADLNSDGLVDGDELVTLLKPLAGKPN